MLEFSTQEKRFILFLLCCFVTGCCIAYYRTIKESDSLQSWRQNYDKLLNQFEAADVNTNMNSTASIQIKVIPKEKQDFKQKLIGKIDINTATVEELVTLERIGPALAQRIIQYREKSGAFKNIDDLLLIKGIGPKTLDRIRDEVCIRRQRPDSVQEMNRINRRLL